MNGVGRVGAGEQVAVGTERDGMNLGRVVVEQDNRLAGVRVPDANGRVPAGGEQPWLRWMERQSGNTILVACERASRLTPFDVPEVDRLLLAGAGESLAIGAEGEST